MPRTIIVAAVLLLVAAWSAAPSGPSDAVAAQLPNKRDDKKPAPTPEKMYVIHLMELERGEWRSTGSHVNPLRENCVNYGRGWVEAGPKGTRKFTGPFEK